MEWENQATVVLLQNDSFGVAQAETTGDQASQLLAEKLQFACWRITNERESD